VQPEEHHQRLGKKVCHHPAGKFNPALEKVQPSGEAVGRAGFGKVQASGSGTASQVAGGARLPARWDLGGGIQRLRSDKDTSGLPAAARGAGEAQAPSGGACSRRGAASR
jgi:hypothetical protein